jgi:predicted ATPase
MTYQHPSRDRQRRLPGAASHTPAATECAPNLDRIAQVIREQAPDIVALRRSIASGGAAA